MNTYGVIGHPVAHSLSPVIHAGFAVDTGRAVRYAQHEVAADDFAPTVHALFARGVRGLNVTLPHKEAALALADDATPRATRAGAANWLHFKDDAIYADNTDGAGLVRDLEEAHAVTLDGARILLLGAGGAARGVLGDLWERKPARLCVANRTATKAAELAAQYTGVEAGGVEKFADCAFDLVLNATAAAAVGEAQVLPSALDAQAAMFYDLMYGADTAFQRFARATGSPRIADGTGMLIEQAAESFALWEGVHPQTAAVRAQLMRRTV